MILQQLPVVWQTNLIACTSVFASSTVVIETQEQIKYPNTAMLNNDLLKASSCHSMTFIGVCISNQIPDTDDPDDDWDCRAYLNQRKLTTLLYSV